MTKIERLNEIHMQTREIRTKFPVQLALNLKKDYGPNAARIQSDRMLSPEGKKQELTELKEGYALDVFHYASQEKEKYIKLAEEAKEIAKELKIEGHEAPDETDLQLFNNDLMQLKNNVMFAINEEKALELLSNFVMMHADPYRASILQENYSEISAYVLNIKNNAATRNALSKIYEDLDALATTPGIQAANDALEMYANAENVKLFKHNTPAYNTVREIIGGVASHLLDDPAKGLAVLNGEATTFANNNAMSVLQ